MSTITNEIEPITLDPYNEEHKQYFKHRASEDVHDPFNILIVCDGFTEDDRNKFNKVCENLAQYHFFDSKPFDLCKGYINIIAYFTPSSQSSSFTSGGNGEGTRFSTTANSDGSYIIGNESALLEGTIDKISFIHGNITFKGRSVWRNPNSKSYGAVGVMLNTDTGRAINYTNKFFVFNIQGYHPDVEFLPLYPHIFLHELGHAIYGFTKLPTGAMTTTKEGLSDEYEEEDNEYIGVEPLSPNLTKVQTVLPGMTSTSPILFEKIKWKHLIARSRKASIESKDPKRVVLNGQLNQIAKRKVGDEELVEGGMLHSRGIFRSSIRCKMRNHRAFEQTDTFSLNRTGFCKVCSNHIEQSIRGFKNASFGSPVPRKVKDYIQENKLLETVFDRIGEPDFQNLETYSAKATASIAALLNQSPWKMDLRSFYFGIYNGHSLLRYANLIIDPAFYLYYLYSPQSNELSYYKNSRTIQIPINATNEDGISFQNGFIGDFEEIRTHLETYWPVKENWGEFTPHPIYVSSEEIEHDIRMHFDWPGYEIIQLDPIRLNAQNLPLATTLEAELQNALQLIP